nr:hypothetical protein CFP56_27189 [Quercus suber]
MDDSKSKMKMEDQKQWEINLHWKVIRLSNANFNMIRASLAEIMGWFDMHLMKAWKVILPFTTISAQIGSLSISDPAWQTWPNPCLIFLSDRPTLAKRNSHIWRIMSHRYPQPTLCGLIPVVNITEWRMMVEAPVMSRWLENLQEKKANPSLLSHKDQCANDQVMRERDWSPRALNDSNTWRRSLQSRNESDRASTNEPGDL